MNNRKLATQTKEAANNNTVDVFETKNISPQIVAMVNNAASILAPLWPLTTFIACNPLSGYESMNFASAYIAHKNKLEITNPPQELSRVNQEMIKWCNILLDEGQASIAMPTKEFGFYQAFKQMAPFDNALNSNFIKELPNEPEKAIALCLQKLQINFEKQEQFLSKSLLLLPGWSGYIKWKNDWELRNKENIQENLMLDFLAVRLIITYILWPNARLFSNKITQSATTTEDLALIKANEIEYQKQLLIKLKKPKNVLKQKRTISQVIFCIDVRSEPIRQEIEKIAGYETLGFAGFFGLPVQIKDSNDHIMNSCPVLITPKHTVQENAPKNSNFVYKQYIKNIFSDSFNKLKYNFATPFALAESLGGICGIGSIIKTLTPNIFGKIKNDFYGNDINTTLNFSNPDTKNNFGIPLNTQVEYAENVLRLMGLHQGFAKIIVFTGHGSTTANNPYASALDCGACGGNKGFLNARIIAEILNNKEVRRGLEDKGIHIPLDTVFYSAKHDTTKSEVIINKQHNQKDIYPELVKQLQKDLKQSGENCLEKLKQYIPNCKNKASFKKRANDWSETRPEWGLARNASFIIGPRSLTKNVELQGRSFLHSYDWESDYSLSLLENIMTAPLVVAQWINCQYLFSTIDNANYGSGSKITHNITGTFAIMQGNASDLMTGLPIQSVMKADNESYHKPQRLLVVIYAPKQSIFEIIDRQDILRKLVYNEWIQIIAMDPVDQNFYKLEAKKWEKIGR